MTKNVPKDLSTRKWARKAIPFAMLLLFSLGANPTVKTDRTALFSKPALKADAAMLKTTIVAPHLDTPLGTRDNVLWCGTFQLAWNETCNYLGEDIKFGAPNPVADALNKKAFTTRDLDEDSYVAMSGLVREGIQEKIAAALRQKFGRIPGPTLIPPKSVTGPEGLVAYACLFKNLEFKTPFERLQEPIRFGSNAVASFGFADYKPEQQAMFPQVRILDYQAAHDFVIELKSKAEQDRLILALVSSKETLTTTIESVLARSGTQKEEFAVKGDVLKVPKFNFDITRRYGEVERKPLVLSKAPPVNLFIVSALQNTRFEMDEKGVKLRSAGHVSMACSAPERPPAQHIMVFDRPFLILMMRAEAKRPYFALWVENGELMVKQ